MRNNLAKTVLAILILLILSLTGCKTGEQDLENIETSEQENNTETSSQYVIEEAKDDESNTLVGSSPVFDRSLTEGDMAVYYLKSSSIYRYCSSTIGNGDATLIIAPDGTTMLIDTQSPANTPAIVATLQALGVETIDYLVFTHEHEDHIGGYNTLLRYFAVKQVYMNEYDYKNSYLHNGMMAELKEKNIPVTYLYEGDSFSFGGIDVKVYNPSKDYVHEGNGTSINSGSLVFKLSYKDSSFLLSGDLEEEREELLVEKYGSELQADVSKINHHGHDTSSAKTWIQTTASKLAILASAQVYSNKAMGRYMLNGATVLATCLNDTIAVWTSGDGTYNVQVEAENYSDYANLPEDVKDGRFVIK